MPNNYLEKPYKINKYIRLFFIFLHLTMSLDFGYTRCRSSRINRFITGLSFSYCFSMSAYTFIYFKTYDLNLISLYWTYTAASHFFLNSSTLIIFKHKCSFYTLQKCLSAIDTKLSTYRDSHNIEVKVILCCLCCVLYKVTLNIIFCINNDEDCYIKYLGVVLYTVQLYSFDIVMIISFCMFYSVHLRIRTLTRAINNHEGNFDYFLEIYRNIAMAIEVAKKCFDVLYVIAMAIFIPDMILQFYVSLTKLKNFNMGHAHNLIVRNLYTVQNYVLLCLPAIAADMTTSSARELKLQLHDKLLQAQDEDQAWSMQKFLNYIDGRPLQFTIFKVIPLDWNLPVAIFNLCISYQIIIVQITKLY